MSELKTVNATDKAVQVLFPTFAHPVWLPRPVAEWIAKLERDALGNAVIASLEPAESSADCPHCGLSCGPERCKPRVPDVCCDDCAEVAAESGRR